MKNPPHILSVVFASAVVLALAGCSVGNDSADDRFVYEVSTSDAGGRVSYMKTVDAAEPLGFEEKMHGTDWAYSPEFVNTRTTTPRVAATPPTGGTANCRILHLHGTAVTVIAEEDGEINEEAVCDAPQPDHE